MVRWLCRFWVRAALAWLGAIGFAAPFTHVEAADPSTLFDDTPDVGTDPGDSGSVELGVKFRSEVDGFITGLRFYKHAANVGPHVASLWSESGELLARETAAQIPGAGWREVLLAAPVRIQAGVMYVASYFAPGGHYAFAYGYFDDTHSNPPLSAPASELCNGNGVYKYGGAPAFPTDTYSASNYWVDVRFETSVDPDTSPPVVIGRQPATGASGVPLNAMIAAAFNEPLDPQSVTNSCALLMRDSNTPVDAQVSYDAPGRRVLMTPVTSLEYQTTYTVRLSAGGVTDLAGNSLVSDQSWSFTTAPPPPGEGQGGPILIIAGGTNPFSRYFAEILRAEGINTFLVVDVTTLTRELLRQHAVAIVGDIDLTELQTQLLAEWVEHDGGKLIAMRPREELAELGGLGHAVGAVSDAYLAIDPSAAPGGGIVSQSIQFHSEAGLYVLHDAVPVAWLYSDPSSFAGHPAVTLRSVGAAGGGVACFAFDLARSIVYTRQGNPAWAGQERDGFPPLRSSDLFYGDAPGDPQRDWVNLDRVAIPQADEQQRLLANMVTEFVRPKMPLPRLWYLPKGLRAAVVMTGDDHANNGTTGRFQQQSEMSDPGCSVDDWECIRSTSYLFVGTPIADAQAAAFDAEGFEIGLHPLPGCAVWTPEYLAVELPSELEQLRAGIPSVPAPVTSRTHCIAWSDWASMPKIEFANGIRLDTNYYYWPPGWVQDRPGMFTGSAIPMRFADLDGSLIDVYQVATQMTDESGQSYPLHADALLDGALGPDQFFGVFCANMHTDSAQSSGADAIIASARARGVPVITARQLLAWLDGRGSTRFNGLVWDSNRLTFTLDPGAGARNLRVMIPLRSANGTLQSVRIGGVPFPFEARTIKGEPYGFVLGIAGAYEALYSDHAFCRADLNSDDLVDDSDFVIFARAYDILDCEDSAMPAGCPADLNADRFVDDHDFVIFATAYDAFLCP